MTLLHTGSNLQLTEGSLETLPVSILTIMTINPVAKRLARLGGLCFITSGFSFAAPFAFDNGDLILGIRATSGTGATKNVFLNLGDAVTLRDNGSLGQLGNIGATLTEVYGANWFDRTNLYFGVIANLSESPVSGFGAVLPINGDPSRTFYISVPTSSPGASMLVPQGSYVSSALGSAGTKLSGLEQMLVGASGSTALEERTDGTAILDQGTQPVQWQNSWTTWNPVPGAAFDIFAGGILQSFGKGGNAAIVDIQRILATNTGADPAGVQGGGTYESSISISSSGEVTAFLPPPSVPEIDVENPPGTGLVTGVSSTSFGTVLVGQSGTAVEFTIRSAGSGSLNLSNVTITGDHADDFILTGPAVTELASSETTTFSVNFTPTAIGTRSATVLIASNDEDESPFELLLTGNGEVLNPEIAIEQSANAQLTSGASTLRLGTRIPVGTQGELVTLTIRNLGNAALSGLAVSKIGGSPGDFVVTAPLVTSLAPSGSTTFTVKFTPTAGGNRSTYLRVASNDGDENPFNIALVGSAFVPAPEITVTRAPNNALIDGLGTLAFGNVVVSKSSTAQTLTIRNTGTATLSGLALSVSGSHAADFKASGLSTNSLAPGQTANFNIGFEPKAAGARSATIQIASNDADESPFDIMVSGTGVLPLPEIAIEQPVRSNLIDGRASRKFGAVPVGSPKALVFTIRNLGNAPLLGLNVTLKGAHRADYSIVQPSLKTLAPGKATTFRVVFKPSARGNRTAELLVRSNDANENPFNISVAGLGAAKR